MKKQFRQVQVHGKVLDTPLKTCPDTLKRRSNPLDTQAFGKPNFNDTQVEEFRTIVEEEHLNRLRSVKTRDQEKKDLAEKMKKPGQQSSDSLKLGYFALKNDLRKELTLKDRELLIDVAEKAGMHIFATPALDPNSELDQMKRTIKHQVDYSLENTNMSVSPAVDVGKMNPEIVVQLINFIEDQYSNSEVPVVGTRGFSPLNYAGTFTSMRYATDRIILVQNQKKKIHHSNWTKEKGGEDNDTALGKVSAELMVALLGADIVGHSYPMGFPQENDKSITEIQIDLLNPEEGLYNEVGIGEADLVPCWGCHIHEAYAEENMIDYFGNQKKVDAARGIHNERTVPKMIESMRESQRDGRIEEWRKERANLDEAMKIATE